MIVVDGRTDREKLFELLKSGGECNELDFKETLDFSKKIDELDFVKDAVSMCNRYPGGYIVIGVDDDGNPSARTEDTNWTQFDGAVLTDKIRKYVQAPLTAISQLNEVDGHILFGLPVKPRRRASRSFFKARTNSRWQRPSNYRISRG